MEETIKHNNREMDGKTHLKEIEMNHELSIKN